MFIVKKKSPTEHFWFYYSSEAVSRFTYIKKALECVLENFAKMDALIETCYRGVK